MSALLRIVTRPLVWLGEKWVALLVWTFGPFLDDLQEHLCSTEDECLSCAQGIRGESRCPESNRDCGHHCNCSWEQDHCHWCGEQFGENSKGGRSAR